MRSIIFDLDGTLMDSETIWFQAYQKLAQECGKTWTAQLHLSHMSSDPAASQAILEQNFGLHWSHAQYAQRLHDIRDAMGGFAPPPSPWSQNRLS